jgi:hypothetical protein
MLDALHGYAVLPSGSSWVIAGTADGWQHLFNATPAAVPTGGGISLTATGRQLVAAIAPYDRMVISPVLTSLNPTAGWSHTELPGGLAASRGAAALDGSAITALVRGAGTTGGADLLRARGDGWEQLTTATSLAGSSALSLDTISWLGGVGLLTGHGSAGSHIAFVSRDHGAHWVSIAGTPSGADAALAPCGTAAGWHVPTLTQDGSLVILRSVDAARHWTSGNQVAVGAGSPAWACHGSTVWVIGHGHGGDSLLISSDGGGHWTTGASVPAGITGLAMVGPSRGFAVGTSHGKPQLWSLSSEAGTGATSVSVPAWVAIAGAGAAGR